MTLALRWTEHAVNQLGAIAEHISLVSPVYAEQTVDRIALRLRPAIALAALTSRGGHITNAAADKGAIEHARYASILI